MARSYKDEIIIAVFLIGGCVAFYFLYGFLLPFVLGLGLAFWCKPAITGIQRLVKNRSLATTLFLVAGCSLVALAMVLFTSFINRDFQRLSQSFQTLATENEGAIDGFARKAQDYLSAVYDFEALEQTLSAESDSLMNELENIDPSTLDMESIQASYEQLVSAFQSGEDIKKESSSGFGFLFMFFSTIMYFVLILYQLDYFSAIGERFSSAKVQSRLKVVLDDFNASFVRYLRLRTRIVLILGVLYFLAFAIMDMPGMILITISILLLSYIPYLQYLALIPCAIGCLVLSIETPQGFLFYFGITVGVFVLASILEEVILTPRIMEKNIGLNPVIMILALSIWEYVLGWQGLLLGIPITILIIIYIKRYFLTAYEKVLAD